MSLRPRVKTQLRPWRRGAAAVQFGLYPGAGVVVDGLSAAEMALLDRLDGAADLPTLYAEALATGVQTHRLTELIDTLRRHRLLVDIPTDRAFLSALTPAHRRLSPDADALAVVYDEAGDGYTHLALRASYQVVVCGLGSLPDAVAELLRAGGVGRVLRQPGNEPAQPCAEAARTERTALAVLTGLHAITPEVGEAWRRRGIPQLPVVSLGHRVVLGPLVRPDQGPCLRCLDLHRCDRDDAWPRVLAQVASPYGGGPVSAETTVTAVAAGLAAMVVHSHLDGRSLPAGSAVEVSLPWPRVEHRMWTPHPRCRCWSQARAVPEASAAG